MSIADVAVATAAPIPRAPAQSMRRPGPLNVISAFSKAFAAIVHCAELIGKAASPADAARQALLPRHQPQQ